LGSEDLPPDSGWNSHIDVSACDEENDGRENYLRYYASEEDRKQWAEDFPDEEIPAHVDPPYDRDCRLPRPEGVR
jgi:hypothetical protein